MLNERIKVNISDCSLKFQLSSTNPPKNMQFEIFISFRGEDTRNTFTGYLYKELVNLGLLTFMDDKKLLIGDSLSEELIRAIEESRSWIVVLSENFASSKWCLRELTKIIDCMAEHNHHHRLLPVFYHVNPSDVRHQSGTFAESFLKHEQLLQNLDNVERHRYSKEIQQWRKALTKVGDLTGVVVNKDSVEVNSIEKIAKQLVDMLYPQKLVPPTRLNDLVDMESRLTKMDTLIGLESNEVRFVGIVGMGGIGKTTIAEVYYDNTRNFGVNHCFLRIYKQNLASLQQQLLSELLRSKDIIIRNENEGARMIEDRLRTKKVFIVLDGVNEKNQLEKLAGSPNWFGPESLIIITTRNRDVLRQPNYKDKMMVYNVELLENNSAFTLFCKNAFGCEFPGKKFENLTKEIVERIKGHPQALKQIGLSLYDKDINIWIEKLKSLGEDYDKHLFNTLKISFDDLEKTSQQVFLDLACFFNGKKKDKVVEILESFDYRPHSELQLLYDRCLIEATHDNTIFIPSHIQDMGKRIECEGDERTRIWLWKDALDAFDERHAIKCIKGIILDLDEKQTEQELASSLFSDMSSLKILEIGNVKLSGTFTCLSKLLRLLKWHNYPAQCLPSNFDSRYLFELYLPVSQTSHLWKGIKGFEKLKVIDLSDSKDLQETPNFTKVPNLESLVLSKCTRLHKIDPSISRLNRLALLDLTCCISLKSFSSIRNCKSLTTFTFAGSGLLTNGMVEDPNLQDFVRHVKQRSAQTLRECLNFETGSGSGSRNDLKL